MNKVNVEQMHNSLGEVSPIWMEYKLARSKKMKSFFCFFEGEDQKYYLPRIQKISSLPGEMINIFSCQGRSGVLKIKKKIMTEEPESNNTLFFIDHDYSIKKVENDIDNVFVTSHYSIENYYTTPSAFGRLIHTEAGLNSGNSIFERIVGNYSSAFEKFEDKFKLINSWIFTLNALGISIKLKRIEVKDFFEIKDSNLVVKMGITFESLLTYYKKRDKDFSLNNITEKEAKLAFNENLKANKIYYHGKMELTFFKLYLHDLINQNKKNELGEGRHLDNVKINVNSDNLLSNWSYYADTDPQLREYVLSRTVS